MSASAAEKPSDPSAPNATAAAAPVTPSAAAASSAATLSNGLPTLTSLEEGLIEYYLRHKCYARVVKVRIAV
jgi:hypothetical protein